MKVFLIYATVNENNANQGCMRDNGQFKIVFR